MAGLIGLAYLGASTRHAMQGAMQRAVRVAELRGVIAHLDEYLTMSARVAALSGDQRWVRRYDEAEPRLDAAINEAVALATPKVAMELARTTDDANRRLVDLERASFARVAAGDRAGAWALLDGKEYADLKAVYAQGIGTFGKDLEALAAAHTAALHRRAWLEVAGLVLSGGILLVAVVLTLRGSARLRAALARTETIARHDPLTGLPNRLLFREHMEHVLGHLRQEGGHAAVLFLDLDGFKAVNDVLGHAAGDELLRAVSSRLRGGVDAADLVVRLGGDEFAIVQRDPRQPAAGAALSERLVAAMREPIEIQGQPIAIGTSIGIALADAATASTNDLLHDADIALYRAKAEGRGTWRVFTPEMDRTVRARHALEADLRRALAEEQFELHYQPQVEADTGRLVAFEALIRWRHPQRGLVSPLEFIPVAEETGLIVGLGAWVLERACADAAGWPERVGVAVNLSPAEFVCGEPVRHVEQALVASGLDATRLQVEITESVLLRNSAETVAVLHRLRAMGVRIAMDDFGTGYSSLSYLRQFPFDKVKIDQSFVRDIGMGRCGVEVVRAMVGLGRALGIKVLVEGVETSEQAALLRTERCEEFQGYLFGRPQPLHETQALLRGFEAAAATPAVHVSMTLAPDHPVMVVI
ncbi:MAG: putative bifunctional diguanylate cyclase/phosphodiesterase [Janthinobacterium lividum]